MAPTGRPNVGAASSWRSARQACLTDARQDEPRTRDFAVDVESVSRWEAEGEGANPRSGLGYFLPRKRHAELTVTVTISAEGRRIPQESRKRS